MPALFSPLRLRDLTLANRIVVSPMCQYSAQDGRASDWHTVHLTNLATSGASLVILEATAVTPDGRITPGDLGLYSDDNEAALAQVLQTVRHHGTAKLGIQLAHAGRKASCARPWEGGKQLALDVGGWVTRSASDVPFFETDRAPRALTKEELSSVKAAFVSAVERADRLGFDVVELHSAHGYLLHQFLSPLSNRRDDEYGGTLSNRMRFPLEVFEAMRAAWPAHKPMGVRLSATDWVEGGWSVDDSVAYARALKERGCDFIDCSSGGSSPVAKVPVGPGFQVPFAKRIRAEAQIATMAVGMITEPAQAEELLVDGSADLVALARGMMWNPRWGWHAAEKLGAQSPSPPQLLLANRNVLVMKP